MSAPAPAPGDGLDRDQRLLALVGEGDRAAFETLYDRYGARVMGFLHGMCRDRQVAEDLTQETFLRVWSAAPRWRPTGRVSTWIFQIAKRRWFTRRARRLLRREREASAAARRRGPDAGPEAVLLAREEGERLARALAGLSARLRLVFVLVRLAGLSYAETAEVAGLRLGTVKSRMAAAEAALRRDLGPGNA